MHVSSGIRFGRADSWQNDDDCSGCKTFRVVLMIFIKGHLFICISVASKEGMQTCWFFVISQSTLISNEAWTSSKSLIGLVGLKPADCWPFVSGILLKGSH